MTRNWRPVFINILLIDLMSNLPCQAVVHTYGDVVVKVESEESLDLDKNEKVPIEQSSPPCGFFV